jgi:hypothetical protein
MMMANVALESQCNMVLLKYFFAYKLYECKKLFSSHLSVKDDKDDNQKTANIKKLGGEFLLCDL